MTYSNCDKDVDAAAELLYHSAPGGDGVLRRVAESVRAVTGGSHVYVAQRRGAEAVVMAVAGQGGPQPSARLSLPAPAPPARLVIPLTLDGNSIGAMVAEEVSDGLRPESQRELALLAGMAARALQNHALIEEAERRVREQLQRQFQVLSRTVGHLKNALIDVTDTLEVLEQEAALTRPQQDHVTVSRRSLGKALRLLSELHEVGRAEAGQVETREEPLDLAHLLGEMRRDYQLAAGTTGVQIQLELANLPLLRTDSDCVRQILDNLLTNALRYSPAGATVTLRAFVRSGRRAQDPASWVRIDVVDRGPGVAEGDAVFEEVERVKHEGQPGFRLALSRRIARLLGGNLTLQTGPGAGATFTLWLPLA